MRLALPTALLAALAGARIAAATPAAGTPAAISAPDGMSLSATYYSAGQPGLGILLLHQCNRDRSAWNTLAEELARAGFHVLTLDYRGYGQSGGPRHADLPGNERSRLTTEVWPGDVDAAFAYLSAQPGVQGVLGAGGASCGVDQSVQLSRRHAEVKSLVLLSGGTDRAGRKSLASKSSPPLFLAAADDDGGIVEVMEWLDASSGNPTNRFVEYAKGGHGSDMFKPHPELRGEIVAWYEATLSGKGKPASTDNAARRSLPTIRLLMMTDEPGGSARVMEQLTAARKNDPKSPILDAGFVNRLGYTLLPDDSKTAVAVMLFNVEGHPDSSNAWDSLGDAYLADGQRDKAREASEKALKLVDADVSEPAGRRKLIRESAQGKLDQLKAMPAPK